MTSRTGAKSRLLAVCLTFACVLCPVLGTANAARAADEMKNDARLEGYKEHVVLDASGAAYYMLFGLLGVIGVSVMFKDAKRSHLD